MGVSGGRLDLGMPKQLPNHGHPLADQQPAAGEAVTEVMDPHVVEPGPRPDAPLRLEE